MKSTLKLIQSRFKVKDDRAKLFGSYLLDLSLDFPQHMLQASLLLLKAMLEAGLAPTTRTCKNVVSKMSTTPEFDANNPQYATTLNLLVKIASFDRKDVDEDMFT